MKSQSSAAGRRRCQPGYRSHILGLLLTISQTKISYGFFVQPVKHRRSLAHSFAHSSSLAVDWHTCSPSKSSRRSTDTSSRRTCDLCMLRNVDLPECVIFYGTNSILDCSDPGGDITSCTVRPGICRILNECREVGTPALLLSEHRNISELQDALLSTAESDKLSGLIADGTLNLRSSLDEFTFSSAHPYYDDPPDLYGPKNHAPSPGFLLDAIETLSMIPRGFGGSSGFGIKQEGVEQRPPLPKHCVVLVSGPDLRPTDDGKNVGGIDVEAISKSVDGAVVKSNTVSRARCTAGKLAGMRILYLEPEGMGTADAEDLADAIVTGLGADNDWEVVSLDDIATPGSYWLNPPVSQDEDGNIVNLIALCGAFQEARTDAGSMLVSSDNAEEENAASTDAPDIAEDMSEDEMKRILADLDSL